MLLTHQRPVYTAALSLILLLITPLLLLAHGAWVLAGLSVLFVWVFRQRWLPLFWLLSREVSYDRAGRNIWCKLAPAPGQHRIGCAGFIVELVPSTGKIIGHSVGFPQSDTLRPELNRLCQWPETSDESFRLPEPDRHTALSLLGLDCSAGRGDITRACRTLMAAFHPDRGGPPALAVLIIQSRDLLLESTADRRGTGGRSVSR